jgi:hypothetical protein
MTQKDSKNEKKIPESEKNRNLILINAQHHQPGASAASGPTRIRFCAKNQENQHDDPETPKKLHPERDPNSKPLALRARGFQALKLALRARFRAQTTSLRSACGLTLGRENAKKNATIPNIFLKIMSRALSKKILGPDLDGS